MDCVRTRGNLRIWTGWFDLGSEAERSRCEQNCEHTRTEQHAAEQKSQPGKMFPRETVMKKGTAECIITSSNAHEAHAGSVHASGRDPAGWPLRMRSDFVQRSGVPERNAAASEPMCLKE